MALMPTFCGRESMLGVCVVVKEKSEESLKVVACG